ncbi:TetR family transcriptional regulator, partial [Candidatus Aerophobetes bacterium]
MIKEEIKEKRKNNQKDKILRAGERIFARKGFHLTTLEEIARGANLAKGTIYLHFLNKRDRFISIIEKKLDI